MARDESDTLLRLAAAVSKADQRAGSLQSRLDASMAAAAAASAEADAAIRKLATERSELRRELAAARTEVLALRLSNSQLLREAELGPAADAEPAEVVWLRRRVLELEDALEEERSARSELEAAAGSGFDDR